MMQPHPINARPLDRLVRGALLLGTAAFATAALASDSPCPTDQVVDIWSGSPLPDIREQDEAGLAPTESTGPSGERPLRHVWVIDHSGSMYPGYEPGVPRGGRDYYVDTQEFIDFVVNDVGTTFRDGQDSAAVVAFDEFAYGWNGSLAERIEDGDGPGFASLRVETRAELAARLDALPAPAYGQPVAGFPAPTRGANDCGREGSAANCSKILEGLAAAKALLKTEPGDGVIWLVTDNIYEGGAGSDGLSAAEVDQNRMFYESIRNDPTYRVVVAYPVVEGPGGGGWLGGSSLFVYGIYCDLDSSRRTPVNEVRRLLGDGASGVLSSAGHTEKMAHYAAGGNPSPGRPFRLKPLDQDVVRIALVTDVEQVRKHQKMGQRVPLKAVLEVENLLNHRVVDSVRFRVTNDTWVGYEPNSSESAGSRMAAILPACAGTFESEEVILSTPIGPGEKARIEVPITMPPVDYELSSFSDLTQIAFNEYVVMGGALRADLLDVKSHLAISPEAFKGTYGANSLPDVFRNPAVQSYTAQFAARTRKIENPGTVLALGVVAGGAAVALLLAAGLFLLKTVSRRLRIDGVDRGIVSIPRLRSVPITVAGQVVARVSQTLSGTIVVRGDNGYIAQRSSAGWQLAKAGESSTHIELRTRK